jgi:exopolysaccharide production protein ExoZ
MITNIQFLRALAALGVVWYHTNFLLWNGAHTEFQGVSLFFVISGYIITLVSEKKNENFLAHRFIRIAPIYWIATILFIIFFYFLPFKYRLIILALFPLLLLFKIRHRFIEKVPVFRYIPWLICAFMIFLTLRSFRHEIIMAYYNNYFSLKALIAGFLFIPYPDINGDLHPVIGIGWTLNLEVFFYLIFGLCLLIHKKSAPVVTCAILLLFKFYNYFIGCDSNICRFYAHDYTSYFILGVVVYYLYEAVTKFSIPVTKTMALCFTAISTAILLTTNISSIFHFYGLGFYAGPTMLVFSALLCHHTNLRFNNKLFLLLGNASYSLYLTHAFILETMRMILDYYHLPDFSDCLPSTLATLSLSAGFALLFYTLVEYPLLVKLREFVDRKSPKPVRIAPDA